MKIKNLLAILALFAALTAVACGGKTDADVQKEVTSRINKPGVTATVKDGVVTLSGTVATQEESKSVEASVKGEGVKSVTNNLQIKPAAMAMPMTPTAPTSTGQNMANSQMNPSSTAGMNSNAAKPK